MYHCYQYNYCDPVVFFGNGAGQYNIERTIIVDVDCEGNFGRSTALGFGFSDFDLDGDIDIFLTTTLDEIGGTFENGYYNSYTIFLFEISKKYLSIKYILIYILFLQP